MVQDHLAFSSEFGIKHVTSHLAQIKTIRCYIQQFCYSFQTDTQLFEQGVIYIGNQTNNSEKILIGAFCLKKHPTSTCVCFKW